MNAYSLSTYRIHTIYQVLIGSHFMVLHIGGGDEVEQLLRTVNFGSLDGRQVHRRHWAFGLGYEEDVLTFLMDQLGTKLLIENAKEEIN